VWKNGALRTRGGGDKRINKFPRDVESTKAPSLPSHWGPAQRRPLSPLSLGSGSMILLFPTCLPES
jgi:hypothetical protein